MHLKHIITIHYFFIINAKNKGMTHKIKYKVFVEEMSPQKHDYNIKE